MRPGYLVGLMAFVAACGSTYQVPGGVGTEPAPVMSQGGRAVSRAVADYRSVAPRVEAAAEAFCREEHPNTPARYCDFRLRLIDDPRMGPNAFQTIGEDGRPLVVMTTALLAETTGPDEIAFVLSHESGHHIAQHIPKQQQQSVIGALVLGTLAAGGGASDQTISDMMDLGASLGGRAYSQSFELEADVLGAFVAARAGYDPERGARLFTRPALAGGGGLLSTHPASPQRQATVARVSQEIRRQQAQGLTPRPVYVEQRL